MNRQAKVAVLRDASNSNHNLFIMASFVFSARIVIWGNTGSFSIPFRRPGCAASPNCEGSERCVPELPGLTSIVLEFQQTLRVFSTFPVLLFFPSETEDRPIVGFEQARLRT